jgi:hypothetical protein
VSLSHRLGCQNFPPNTKMTKKEKILVGEPLGCCPKVEESEEKKKLRGIIETYKKLKPEKYERRKEELQAKLDAIK